MEYINFQMGNGHWYLHLVALDFDLREVLN